jgi:2-polyprenyl-3-methyl-5-hydroxy-6-metoxy-1,4-benzoquinol methylase/glycosyltransferase involved in cell wall biosynthesis
MTVSLCMIVRDVEDKLDACLASVEKYVDEIIIVDTGSVDGTKEVAKKHGAKIFDFNPETNPDSFLLDNEDTGAPPPYTGKWILADFAGARNLSFEKATSDFVFWVDSDDVVQGAENIPSILKELEGMDKGCAWFRYDYAFSPEGKPICQLWRERIIRKGASKWVNPIHEVCIPILGSNHKNYDSVVISHRREEHHAPPVAHRNYKVLRKQYEKEKDSKTFDARTLFYLGNEAKFMNVDEAIGYFEQYLRLSGWDEERTVARILVGQLYEVKGDIEAAFRSYSSASYDFPSNPDSYFALARLAYKKNDWAKCIAFTEAGLALGNPHSAIMYNPLDRSYHPHTYYNVALNNVGRVLDASKSCEAGLEAMPEDANLQFNKKLYDDYLAKNPQQEKQPTAQSISLDGASIDAPPNLPSGVIATLGLQIWKELLRYDEVVKAKAFLESLPYVTEGSEALEKAKKLTDEILEFATSPTKMQAQYNDWHKVEEAIPFNAYVPSNWSQYPRYSSVMSFFDGKPRLRVLDIGCQDGWISNRIARMGHSVVGLDFSQAYLEIAKRNARSEGLDTTYILGFIEELRKAVPEKYDVVICTEVIEHSADPDKLIKDIKSVLKPGGTLLLSTPKGHWFQGQPHQYASAWNAPRQHIQAFTVKSLAKTLAKHLHVKSCHEMPIPMPDVPGQGTLFAEAVFELSLEKGGHDIVFYTGPAWEWWNANSPYREGTGGSELACVEMAKAYAQMGHRVRVYSDCPGMEGIYDEVEYLHFSRAQPGTLTCDVFISSRQPTVLPSLQVTAKARFLWVHDIHVGAPSAQVHEALLTYDRIFCLSKWHKEYFLSVYPFLDPEKVVVSRNGILIERFPHADHAKENKLIYTSSGNRGLELLLDLFPRIKEKVPDVELDVYYGFNVWRAAARNSPDELAQIDRIEKKMKETPGVNAMGRVNQQELAQAWLRAKVWAYPTWFTETYCISALEAQAAGAVPVTTNLAALSENVYSGFLLSPPLDEEYNKDFVDAVVELLTDEEERQLHVKLGRETAEKLTWSSLALDWRKQFDEVIEAVKVNPIHRFVP